jgi:trk system potassium uptake protein
VIDFRPVLFVIGILLTTLAASMCPPLLVDLVGGDADWRVFAWAAALTLFVGIALVLTNRCSVRALTVRQAFLLTAGSWIIVAAFAALPLAFSRIGISYTDAYFEAMSGLTTTGATVIVGLDTAPQGILLWRGLLHGLGGIGIIAMAVAILPLLQVGGMQLFRMESSDRSEKVMPRAAQIAGGITIIYVSMIVVCTIALWGAGMNLLEASTHAMSALATGGFSTSDDSVGHFKSIPIDLILIVGMFAGGMPFTAYLQAVRGQPGALWRDTQIRWYFWINVVVTIVLAVGHYSAHEVPFWTALEQSAFNVVSIVTTTGFVNTDYNQWGGFAHTIFFMITFVGGCAGSTAGAIKTYRIAVFFETARAQVHRLVHPHGVFIPQYNGRSITEEVEASVLSFFFLYIATWALVALIVSLTGTDTLTALTASAATIGNVGPGLGDVVGPVGNYSTLSDVAKWALSANMLVGRLELFTVFVLFTRAFWRG